MDKNTRLERGYEINCLQCGKLLNGNARKFCTPICRGVYVRANVRVQSYTNQDNFREFVFERDNFTCKLCKKKFNWWELHCHHEIPLYKGGKDIIDNCISLCVPCHKKIHKVW